MQTMPYDECYCGRMLEVQPAIVCSGCRLKPSDCTCDELRDGEDDA
jgi:hypothetical protein